MNGCHCNSGIDFDKCCSPYLEKKDYPKTAEALLRSRYSAFVCANVDYIRETHDPVTRGDFSQDDVLKWATESKWLGLKINSISNGLEKDERGEIDFVASYEQNLKVEHHHEIAQFVKKDGRWFFHDGSLCGNTIVRDHPKVGRNDPCNCGSGKKAKKCCYR